MSHIPDRPSQPRPDGAVITLLRASWPVILGIVVLVTVGRYGFNPTDEGFVNGVAYRVLHGEVPHRDFIWGRPVGTAYLHAPELLLPFPMVMTSRVIALAEIIGYTLILGALVIQQPPWRWRLVQAVTVAVGILVNINTLPLMVWPTSDGILLVSGGALLLQSGIRQQRLWPIALGFALLGASTVMKQSFWPAPIFGLVWLVMASPRPGLRRRTGVALLATCLVPAAYVSMIAVSGGLDEMLLQFTSVRPVVGQELLTLITMPVVTVALALLVGFVGAARRSPRDGTMGPVVVPVLTALGVGGIVAVAGLGLRGEWAAMLWWLVVARVGAELAWHRRIDWPGLVLIGLGWMAALSWGLAAPTLVGGSLAAFLVLRSVESREDAPRGRVVSAGGIAGAVVLVLLSVPAFVGERLTDVYRDLPADELTARLDGVHPDLAGVLTNEVTASYLDQLVRCVDAYPADEVAVLPDNPVIYPMLELDNPFPADWILPLEIVNSEQRFVDAAARLDERGGYLVLVQPVGAHRLHQIDSLEPDPASPFRDPAHGRRILDELTGTAIECGDFSGVWSR